MKIKLINTTDSTNTFDLDLETGAEGMAIIQNLVALRPL